MKGRGLDFEQRFRTSRWAEDTLIQSLTEAGLLAYRIGLSSVKDKVVIDDKTIKVPDLLIFSPATLSAAQKSLLSSTDLTNEPPEKFHGGDLSFAFEKALCAIEVEFSPYRASEMKQREWKRRTDEQLARRLPKQAKAPTAPNIFVKEEDLSRLLKWGKKSDVPIIVVHVFDQEGFSIDLREIERFDDRLRRSDKPIAVQLASGIFKESQVYDRVDAQGAREEKILFKVSPAASVRIGAVEGAKVKAQIGVSSSGKYVAHVIFKGGQIRFTDEFVAMIRAARTRHNE